MAAEKYSHHDLDTAQRLTAVEVRLEHVESNVHDFRAHNDKRLDELREMLVTAQASRSRNLTVVLEFIGKNWKILAVIIAIATGAELSAALGLLGGCGD